jgi:hypothetical protein
MAASTALSPSSLSARGRARVAAFLAAFLGTSVASWFISGLRSLDGRQALIQFPVATALKRRGRRSAKSPFVLRVRFVESDHNTAAVSRTLRITVR